MPTFPPDFSSRKLHATTRFLMAGLLLTTIHPVLIVAAQDTSIEQLRHQLLSADTEACVDAARQLGEFGPAAREAVPELGRALESDDLLLRYEAAGCLGGIGPDARPCVDQLRSLLDDDAPMLRHAALNALRKIASPSIKVREAFEERMRNDELPANRVAAARALAELAARADEQTPPSAAIDVLIEGLKSPQAHVASDATRGLAAVGAAATQPVLKVFRSGSLEEQVNATQALVMLGLSAEAAGPSLLSALKDCDELLKRHIIRALPSIGADPDAAILELRLLLDEDSREVRLSAVAALGEYGELAAPAAGDLARLLSDDDLLIQRAAASTLGKLGPHAASAVPQLIDALSDDDGAVTIEAAHSLGLIGQPAVQSLVVLLEDAEYRNLAATVLGDIGPLSVDSAAALTKLLDVPDKETRRAALLGLAGIGPAARAVAADRLLQLLREPSGNVRAGAAYALARLEAQEAVPDLFRLIQETTDAREKLAAAWALVMLQPSAEGLEKAVPILMEGLGDDWELVRKECVVALAALGPRAESASKRLLSLVDDPDPLVRAEASAALYEVGTNVETLVPLMIEGLNDVSPEVRYAATYVLGSIGPKAEPAVLRLKEMINYHVEFDRILAAWALLKIAPTQQTERQAVPLMLRALAHSRPGVRREAATVLGDVGGGRPVVRTALQKAASDADADVRDAAQRSLDKLSQDRN